jgi:hypothetical protein
MVPQITQPFCAALITHLKLLSIFPQSPGFFIRRHSKTVLQQNVLPRKIQAGFVLFAFSPVWFSLQQNVLQ